MCSGRSFTRQARIAITSFPASDFQTGAVEAAKATNIELVTLLSSNTSYFDKWFNRRSLPSQTPGSARSD
jgi:hypothetical protein